MDLLRARRDGSGSPHFGQLSALCATGVPHSAQETRAMIDPEVRDNSILAFPHGNIQPMKIEIQIFIFIVFLQIFAPRETVMCFCGNQVPAQSNLNLNLHLSI